MARAPKALTVYFDPVTTIADAEALRAVRDGRASPDQQRTAIDWILQRACRIHSHCFVPHDPHGSAHLEGRRSAGILITNAMKLDAVTAARLAERRAEGEQG